MNMTLFSESRYKFDTMEQKSEQGFNNISAVHKQLQVNNISRNGSKVAILIQINQILNGLELIIYVAWAVIFKGGGA